MTETATTGHRIMLDSTSPAAVLAAVKARMTFGGLPISLAGGYLDGRFVWPASAWADLATAGIAAHQQVSITVFGTGAAAARAGAGDSEPGDMTPAEVAAWAKREHDARHWPVPYCDRSHKAAVTRECRALGLHLSAGLDSDYGLWVATLDGSFTDTDGSDLRTQPGVVAIQYTQANSPIHVAGTPPDLDVSLVVRPSWRALPTPPPKTLDAFLVLPGQAGGLTGRAVVSRDGGRTWS